MLRAQYRQIVTIDAHHTGFVLDTGGDVTLVEPPSLGEHRVLELDGGVVEEDHVDPVGVEGDCKIVDQLCTKPLPVRGVRQHCVVD